MQEPLSLGKSKVGPVTLEMGKFGRRAVLHSGWTNKLLGYLRSNEVIELELNQAKGWTGQDLSFLHDLNNIKSFEILDFNIRNVEPIHCLGNLAHLHVSTYCSTKIDFSSFPKLRSCILEWRPKAVSIFDCDTLQDLFINRYSGKVFSPFSKLVQLESLAVYNSPIPSLDGISALTKLRSLRLANLRRLASLDGIEHLANIEELDIHSCRSISHINQIESLLRIKNFGINECGKIESLKPLARLADLELVGFYGSTNIVDGDLSPLLHKRKLIRAAFQNRRHYSHRRDDFVLSDSG